MIGAVQLEQDPGGEAPIVAVHRTYLTPDGRKAPVPDPKMTLGRCKGAAVRLGQVNDRLAVAEGIETALSILTACPDLKVWAALSSSGMRALILPVTVNTVILCPDGDNAGRQAADRAAERFLEQGCTVKIADVPEGRDLNDTLKNQI